MVHQGSALRPSPYAGRRFSAGGSLLVVRFQCLAADPCHGALALEASSLSGSDEAFAFTELLDQAGALNGLRKPTNKRLDRLVLTSGDTHKSSYRLTE